MLYNHLLNFHLIFICQQVMNFSFISLSILCGISLTLLILATKSSQRFYHYIFKPLTIVLIIFFGLFSDNIAENKYSQLILLGLLLSFFGDVFLMKGKKEFLFGMIAFFLAHIFYIIAFSVPEMKFNLFLYGIIFTISLSYYIFLFPSLDNLRIPVFLYTAVISFMLYFAISYYLVNNDLLGKLILSGAILFTISDMLLAIRQFKSDFPFSSQLVYLTYFPAQYLFCLTIWIN